MGYYVPVEPGVNVYIHDVNPSGQKVILFLHGWPLSHRAYEYQFDRLPGKGIRCIGMDIRGFGWSDKPWSGYSYDRLADDVKCVVDALHLQDITLAGHSMGGAIAVRYMARHQGYGVSRLALFAAAAPSFTQRPDFPYGFTKEEVNQYLMTCYNDRPLMLQQFGNIFFFQYVTSGLSDFFFQLGLQAAGWSTAQCLVSLRDESLFADLPQIRVPTLILHGIHDKVCPFPLGEAQKAAIPNATLIPLEFSGHGGFYDQRDKFNQELARFVGANQSYA